MLRPKVIILSSIWFRFELISAPFGSTLDPERGLLRWKATSNLVMDKWTESFVVKAVGGCGEQTYLEVTLDVLRCHCQNGGHCRTDMSIQDGSPVCQCPKGFTGSNDYLILNTKKTLILFSEEFRILLPSILMLFPIGSSVIVLRSIKRFTLINSC